MYCLNCMRYHGRRRDGQGCPAERKYRAPIDAPRYRYSYPLQAWELVTDSKLWPAYVFPPTWGQLDA